MLNFLSQTVSIFSLQIMLTKRCNTFWSRAIVTIWHRKSQTKIGNIHEDFLNYANFLNYLSLVLKIIFCTTCSKIHILYTTETTYELTNPILCHCPLPTYFQLSLCDSHEPNSKVEFKLQKAAKLC